jgi:hypothetical protein
MAGRGVDIILGYMVEMGMFSFIIMQKEDMSGRNLHIHFKMS